MYFIICSHASSYGSNANIIANNNDLAAIITTGAIILSATIDNYKWGWMVIHYHLSMDDVIIFCYWFTQFCCLNSLFQENCENNGQNELLNFIVLHVKSCFRMLFLTVERIFVELNFIYYVIRGSK